MIKEFHGGNDPYPIGAIQPWVGPADDIPFGWSYCDGNNGTPDLRNMFVKCVPNATTAPGTTGGQNTYSMIQTQLPLHTHTGVANESGAHTHYLSVGEHNGNRKCPGFPRPGQAQPSGGPESITTNNGSHNHGTTFTDSEGNSESINNEPARLTAGFIKKIDPSNYD